MEGSGEPARSEGSRVPGDVVAGADDLTRAHYGGGCFTVSRTLFRNSIFADSSSRIAAVTASSSGRIDVTIRRQF